MEANDRPDAEQVHSIEKMIKKERNADKPKKASVKITKKKQEKMVDKPKKYKLKIVAKDAKVVPDAVLDEVAVPVPVPGPVPGPVPLKLKIVEKTPVKLVDKPSKFTPPYNKLFMQVLEDLIKLMKKQRDFVHQMAYKRALETVRGITEDITDVAQLNGKKYIGPIIISKMEEYLETGTLKLFEREKEAPGYEMREVYEAFSNIYGVGPKKAQDLIDKGVKTMDELRERQDELLNDSQKAGLKYYDDILKRIPRKEIDEYNSIFSKVFDKVKTGDSKYEIVGSYRRGLPESGDIDMIITSPEKGIFKKFTDALLEENIILETLSSGASKCLVIARLPKYKTARRVDFLYSSPEEFPFAILYFTGSKEFNTVMRGHALTMGMSLNEHGLSKKEPGKKKEEMITGKFKSEADIFEYLNLVYKEPGERLGGQAVVILDKELAGKDKYRPAIWKRGNYSESCDEVCAKQDLTCDVGEMNTLDSEKKNI